MYVFMYVLLSPQFSQGVRISLIKGRQGVSGLCVSGLYDGSSLLGACVGVGYTAPLRSGGFWKLQ